MKTLQIAAIITLTVVVTVLVTASALVLLNTPKTSDTSGIYANYPNGYGYNPYPTANPQITVPTPAPTAPNPQTTPTQPPIAPSTLTPITPPSTTSTTTQIPIANAKIIAQNYLVQLGNPDLAVKEVDEYLQNFHITVNEKSTGAGAFELVIDKYTGVVSPDTGPNTTWNTKYGTGYTASYPSQNGYGYGFGPGVREGEGGMGGWYGGYGGYGGTPTTPTTPTTFMPITSFQAISTAQQYLNSYYPGTTTGSMTTFYGYYNFAVLLSGRTYGVLSVNGYTGQVWFHTWHGAFLQ